MYSRQFSRSAKHKHSAQATRCLSLGPSFVSPASRNRPQAHYPTLLAHSRCRSSRVALVRAHIPGASSCRRSALRCKCRSCRCCWRCWRSFGGCWRVGWELLKICECRSLEGCCGRRRLEFARCGLGFGVGSGREPWLMGILAEEEYWRSGIQCEGVINLWCVVGVAASRDRIERIQYEYNEQHQFGLCDLRVESFEERCMIAFVTQKQISRESKQTKLHLAASPIFVSRSPSHQLSKIELAIMQASYQEAKYM
jgi:hypothetical protein